MLLSHHIKKYAHIMKFTHIMKLSNHIINLMHKKTVCKINLAIFDVAYIFDHLRAILDISFIKMTRTLS